MLAIQAKCPPAARWQESEYLQLAGKSGGMILVAELGTALPPRIVGFIVVRRAADEAEVINLAVNPAHQRLGVGKALLTEARKRLVQAGVIRLFLEVRTSNAPALALYYSLGFAGHSVRQDYYRDPLEDAQILCLELHAGRGLSS